MNKERFTADLKTVSLFNILEFNVAINAVLVSDYIIIIMCNNVCLHYIKLW